MHLPDFGPFAPWVWPAFGITLCVFVINIVLTLRDRQKIRRQLRDFFTETSH